MRYIKIFRAIEIPVIEHAANREATESGAEIISATLCFAGAGRTYEEPVLTVVFEKKDGKRAKNAHSESEIVRNG